MPADLTQQQVIEREFLPTRAKILEIAAALDRMDRADDSTAQGAPARGAQEVDQSQCQLQQALAVLLLTKQEVAKQDVAKQDGAKQDRAERVQQIFSLPYDAHWQDAFGMTSRC
jgi:hypothetical protein